MDLRGRRVLITGGAAGLGAATAAELAKRGCTLTLLDVDAAAGEATAASLRGAGADARFLRCDVTDARAFAAALDAHWAAHGGLDICFLNAGIEEMTGFLDTPDDTAWRRVMDIDAGAVIEGVRQVVRRLRATHAPAVIVINASAAGLYPVPMRAVYAAAKGAAVHFTRSLADLHPRDGIRVCAVCPRFAETGMVARMLESAPDEAGDMIRSASKRLLRVSEVVDGVLECMADESNAGRCMQIAADAPRAYFRFPGDARRGAAGAAAPPPRRAPPPPALAAWAAERPATYELLQVHTLSPDFRAATRLARAPLPTAVPVGRVLVRRLWAGVNASDVNFSSGRYFGGDAAARARLPFPAGFETVGVVAAVGPGVADWAPGDAVGSFSYGGFAEFALEDAASLLSVGAVPTPEAVALLTSALTASIALEQAARLAPRDTVLVTAAAGGTGQFAVQLARAAGAHVVATCGGAAKAALLRRLGAHRVIDYTAEDIKAVLKAEYPKGVDVVYESVGGAMFETALNALAPRGRLVVIGAISQYSDGWQQPSSVPGLTEKLLWRSATCVGFFLPLHAKHFRRHLARLVAARAAGQLECALDPRRFVGLASVADAVEHLHGGRSLGKVVVQVPRALPPGLDAHRAPAAKL